MSSTVVRQGTADNIFEISDIYKDSVRELCKGEYTTEVISLWENAVPPEARLPSIENGSLWVVVVNGCIGGYPVAVPGELGLNLAKKDRSVVILESTLTAVPFYEKLGFTEVDRGFFTHGVSDIEIPVINIIYDEARS